MNALHGRDRANIGIVRPWRGRRVLSLALAIGLAGCGGGGGGATNVKPTSSPPPPGYFDVPANETTVNSANLSGSYGLTKDGAGKLILTGTDTYGGGTRINAGTLQIGNGGTKGSIVGDVLDDGALVFDHSDTVTFAGKISGTGSLEQAGTGVLILTADSTYTGGTTIGAGSLQLGYYGTTGWITGNVKDNGSLIFERSNDVTFDGTISGSGSVVQGGYGTLILTADSTYAGGTQLNSGQLEIPRGAKPGSGPITIIGGTFQVDPGVSLSNVFILNSGTLDNEGKLSNTTGDTPIQFQPGSAGGSTLLNHDGAVIEGATLTVDLDGAPTVTNDGAGSTISSSGGIAIQLERGGTVENTGGGLIDGHTVAINLPGGGTVTNGVGSTIKVTETGADSIYVPPSASGYAAPSFILNNEGTIIGNVDVSESSADATLSARSVIQGNLDLGASGRLTLTGGTGTVQLFSQAVTGTTTFGSALTKSGDGTWIIDTNNFQITSASNSGTSIWGGTLQVGNGGTAGSIGQGGVDITGNGSLVFDHSDDVTLAGHILAMAYTPGIGVLVQAGSGKLTLTSSQIAPDEIKIENGTLQIGNGGTGPSSIGSSIVNNGSLVIDTSGTLFIPQAISGTGSLTMDGPGTLFLTERNPGAQPSSYTGGTRVDNGVLQAGQLIPGDVSVGNLGTLDGVPGVAGNLSSSGTVAVHGGDTTVGGNYTQSSGGTLAVSLGSKLDVTGTATLNGGTLEVTGADNGYVSNTHTTVLSAAGGLSGTFAMLVKDSGVVFTATTINYDANSVWLDTTGLNVTTAAAGAGVSYTPASMGSAVRVQSAFVQLDQKIAAGNLFDVSRDFLSAAGKFQRAPTLQAAQASLQSLSGQLHTVSAAMTFEAIDASSRALSDRFDNLLDNGPGFGMWTRDLSIGGDMVRAGFDGVGFQLNGWLIGSDRRVGQSGVVGYAFGQSRGQQRLNRTLDHDNSRSTEGMLYAGWLGGDWYMRGRVGFGHFRQDISRQILLGYSVQAVGTQYSGGYDVVHGETGLHFGLGQSHITPFVNMEYARIARASFAEQGAGGFGLRSSAQTMDRWQAGLGLRADRHWDLGRDRAMDLNAAAQWQRTVASRGEMFDASFVGLQQWQPLVGIGLSRYSGLFAVALDAKLSARMALAFSYDYELGQREHAQMLAAHFRVAF